MKYSCWALSATLAAAVSSGAVAQSVDFSGDLRFGYIFADRDERNGTNIDSDELRLRARAGLQWNASEVYSFKVRYAGLVNNEDNVDGLRLYRGTGSQGSLQPGQSTLDELHVRARYGNWTHTVGRFQTNARLVGVIGRTFSRINSGGFNVSWTDGIRSVYSDDNGWNYTVIVERNDKEQGASAERRAPLGFDKSSSRATYYFAIDSRDTDGLWAQRSLDVTYIPSALYSNGFTSTATENYLGITGRVAMQKSLQDGMKLVGGVQVAYAPETPRNAVMGLPGTGDADSLSWTFSGNLMDIAPGHSVGVMYGKNEAGWLLSSDLRANSEIAEVRYAWRPMSGHLFEARVRHREDLVKPIVALRERSEVDGFLRYTISL